MDNREDEPSKLGFRRTKRGRSWGKPVKTTPERWNCSVFPLKSVRPLRASAVNDFLLVLPTRQVCAFGKDPPGAGGAEARIELQDRGAYGIALGDM